jgi:hypothetical protein
MAHLSDEHLYFDALWVKVMRTLISPGLVWTSYNVAISLCSVLRNVTSLSLSRISSLKRSWKLSIGVSTCLNDLWITWSLKYNIWRSSQTDIPLYLYFFTSPGAAELRASHQGLEFGPGAGPHQQGHLQPSHPGASVIQLFLVRDPWQNKLNC